MPSTLPHKSASRFWLQIMQKIFALPRYPEQKKRAMCFLMYDGVGTFFGSQRGLKAREALKMHIRRLECERSCSLSLIIQQQPRSPPRFSVKSRDAFAGNSVSCLDSQSRTSNNFSPPLSSTRRINNAFV